MAQYRLTSNYEAKTPKNIGQFGSQILTVIPKGKYVDGEIVSVPSGYGFSKGLLYKKGMYKTEDVWIDSSVLEKIIDTKQTGSVVDQLSNKAKTTTKQIIQDVGSAIGFGGEGNTGTESSDKILGMKKNTFYIVLGGSILLITGVIILIVFRKKIFKK